MAPRDRCATERQTTLWTAVIAIKIGQCLRERDVVSRVILSLTNLHLCQLALLSSATCWHNPCRGANLAVRGIQARGPLTLAGGPVPPWGPGLGPPWGQAASIGLGLVPARSRFQGKVMQPLLKHTRLVGLPLHHQADLTRVNLT